MEPEGCPRKSSTSSPPAPRSSTPELQSLADQASLPGIHKPLQGRYLGEDTDDEGDVRRPTDGLSHRKVSLASSQPRSPPAKEPAAVKTVASPSILSRRKRKRASIRKLLRSPSAAPSTPAVMSMNADATASVSMANRVAIEDGPATHQLARVRTPDHADTSTVPTEASAGLARHQGMEELQAIDQNRQRRTPLRETTNTQGHMSPGCVSGYLRLRTPSPSCPGTPPSTAGGVKGDLRRLMGSLDLTSERPPPATPNWMSPAPLTSSPEMTECPFALPPDVGSGFVMEPPVVASSSHATAQRKFRLTRTRSLPDLRQQAAAPEFLRNRLILQTDDTVYLPFILRKEYVIRTKLRVSFSLLKSPVVKRSHSEGHVTEVTFLQQSYSGCWDETDTEMEASDWRVDEGCNFFDLCYFRCKCCKKHAGPMAAVR